MKNCLKRVLLVGCIFSIFLTTAIGCVPIQKPIEIEIEEEKREFLIPPSFREKQEIDFAVLNEVERIIRRYSVSREKLIDSVVAAEKLFDFFFAYLEIKPEQIPEWAQEILREAINEARENRRGRVNYRFLNEILEKLIQEDPYLKCPEGKFHLLEAIIEEFIKILGDPFTGYVNPLYVRLGITEPPGQPGGLGFRVEVIDERFVVTEIVAESPAEEAGLRVGDILIYINDKDLTNATIRAIILYIRGRRCPEFILTVERYGEIDIFITRGVFRRMLSSYPPFGLPDGRNTGETLPYNFSIQDRKRNSIAGLIYIKMNNFSPEMIADLYFLLNQVNWEEYRKLILDLRENPGGFVFVTIAALSYFLPPSTVAIVLGDHAGRHREQLTPRAPVTIERAGMKVRAHPNLVPPDTEIVVLVGERSASGAEVFASALRDHQRAKIVGSTRTFGKGTANRWLSLPEGYGALFLATSLWFAPEGEFVESRGLLPQVLVEWTERDHYLNRQNPNWDPEIFAALEIFKKIA